MSALIFITYSIQRCSLPEPVGSIKKGDELGTFNMGSTVIVLTPKGFFIGLPAVRDEAVRLGENLELKEF